MSKINFFITLFVLIIVGAHAQTNPITTNRSKGTVATNNPLLTPGSIPYGTLPGQFGLNSGVESFRFGSGLVTQLDKGASFTFEADRRWFSLGRLDVGTGANTRTLYGLRMQRSGQGLTMGYGTLASTPDVASNPFIEWIGNSGLSPAVNPGNLQFFTANSPGGPSGPGVRKLSFTLRSDLTALLGEVSVLDSQTAILEGTVSPKLEINATDNRDGLHVTSSSNDSFTRVAASFTGINTGGNTVGLSSTARPSSVNGEGIAVNASSNARFGGSNAAAKVTGVSAFVSNGTVSNTGVISTVRGSQPLSENFGVKIDSQVNGSNNYGLFSSLIGSTNAGTINYGIYSEATGSNALAGFINGPAIINTVTFPSDERLKKDIKVEENLLSKVKQLTPVNYYFKQEKDKTGLNLPTELQHGFIAQELEKVFPELIKEVRSPVFDKDNKQTGYFDVKTVSYIELISVLVGAVQELATEVETLKGQNVEKTLVVNKTSELSTDELDKLLRTSYSLDQNVPNPFSSVTSVNYSLPENDTTARILLLNLNGQLIQEYKLKEPKGTIIIDGSKLQKGMYLYSLVSDNTEILTKKMILR